MHTILLQFPVTISSNYPLRCYVDNHGDLEALQNRCHSLFLWIKLVDDGNAETAHMRSPQFEIKGETLLGLFVKTFDDPFNLPKLDPSIPIQIIPNHISNMVDNIP